MKSTSAARLSVCTKVRDHEARVKMRDERLCVAVESGVSDAIERIAEGRVRSLKKDGSPEALAMADKIAQAVALRRANVACRAATAYGLQ